MFTGKQVVKGRRKMVELSSVPVIRQLRQKMGRTQRFELQGKYRNSRGE